MRLLQLLHPLSHLAEGRVPALDLIIPAGETYCKQAWDKDLTLPQKLTSPRAGLGLTQALGIPHPIPGLKSPREGPALSPALGLPHPTPGLTSP